MAGYPSGQQGQGKNAMNPGFVAVCSAKDCSYNENQKCFANGINVKIHNDQEGLHADCETFTKNQHMD